MPKITITMKKNDFPKIEISDDTTEDDILLAFGIRKSEREEWKRLAAESPKIDSVLEFAYRVHKTNSLDRFKQSLEHSTGFRQQDIPAEFTRQYEPERFGGKAKW